MAGRETPKYGLPFERMSDEPGISLHGGLSGTEKVLAESVESELERIDEDIQNVDDKAAEAGLGWTPIAGNLFTNISEITVDATAGGKYPAGTFSMMRLFMRGSMASGSQWITLNINNSLTSDSHRRAWVARRASDGAVTESGFNDSTVWRVGFWPSALIGNTCEVMLYETGIGSFVSFAAKSTFITGFDNTNRIIDAWGRLNENRTVSSLRIGRVGTENFAQTRYWLEGYREA